MSTCWICGHQYVTDYCTKCGPPEDWGPTDADYARLAATRKKVCADCGERIEEGLLCTRCYVARKL